MPEFLDERQKFLELGTRRKVYETVKQFPGSHFREIERKCKLSTGLVKYHLNYLAKHNIVKEEKAGNNLRYFPIDFSQDTHLLGILRQKTLRDVILYVLSNENCNQEQLAKALRLSPSTLSWHLKKLQDAQMIGFERKGRKSFYRVTTDKEELMKLLITHRQSFFDTLVDNTIEMWG